ncbi:MAG: UDP-2,3-diacylglucosamine diphosphatase LpxI [Candidatus Coatesbacteria bacterium]|nr:MAG: UDP-2,3-diacylglucosamine diphosphatase LpxI [Candidatus Coatesbacteria bacterium]
MKQFKGKIGIIAGSGQIPVLVAEEAIARHPEGVAGVMAVCVTEEAARRLRDRIHVERVALGQAGRAIKLLHKNEARYCVFAGKVEKAPVLAGLRFDARAVKILARVRDFTDDRLMAELVCELEEEGFEVLPQTDILERYVVQPRVYTRRKPSKGELEDVAFGLEKARGLASLGIGQTVVVRKKAVLAAEALEGTDETVRRGAKLADGKGGVVVKAMKPGQDRRFDIPTVGLATLRLVLSGGLKVLALEAGSSFLIDREEVVAAANGGKISVVGVGK